MTPYEAEKFKTTLYETINNCNLTFPTAFFIIEKIYSEMKEQYYSMATEPPEFKTVRKDGLLGEENIIREETELKDETLD